MAIPPPDVSSGQPTEFNPPPPGEPVGDEYRPWKDIVVALEGWEYAIWEEWFAEGDLTEQDKRARLLLGVLQRYDPDASLNQTESRSMRHPGLNDVFRFRFSLYGDPDKVSDAILGIHSQLIALTSNYKTYAGKAYAVLEYEDGDRRIVRADITKNADIDDAFESVMESTYTTLGAKYEQSSLIRESRFFPEIKDALDQIEEALTDPPNVDTLEYMEELQQEVFEELADIQEDIMADDFATDEELAAGKYSEYKDLMERADKIWKSDAWKRAWKKFGIDIPSWSERFGKCPKCGKKFSPATEQPVIDEHLMLHRYGDAKSEEDIERDSWLDPARQHEPRVNLRRSDGGLINDLTKPWAVSPSYTVSHLEWRYPLYTSDGKATQVDYGPTSIKMPVNIITPNHYGVPLITPITPQPGNSPAEQGHFSRTPSTQQSMPDIEYASIQWCDTHFKPYGQHKAAELDLDIAHLKASYKKTFQPQRVDSSAPATGLRKEMPLDTTIEELEDGRKIEVTKWHCGCESYIDLSLPKDDPDRAWTSECDKCSAEERGEIEQYIEDTEPEDEDPLEEFSPEEKAQILKDYAEWENEQYEDIYGKPQEEESGIPFLSEAPQMQTYDTPTEKPAKPQKPTGKTPQYQVYHLTPAEVNAITEHAWETGCAQCFSVLEMMNIDPKGNYSVDVDTLNSFPEAKKHFAEIMGGGEVQTSQAPAFDPDSPEFEKIKDWMEKRRAKGKPINQFGRFVGLPKDIPTLNEWGIAEYLRSLGVKYEMHYPIGKIFPEMTGKPSKIEFDIWIPDLVMAIEINPGWHKGGPSEIGRVAEIDRLKEQIAKEHGIELVTIDPGDSFADFASQIDEKLAPELRTHGVDAPDLIPKEGRSEEIKLSFTPEEFDKIGQLLTEDFEDFAALTEEKGWWKSPDSLPSTLEDTILSFAQLYEFSTPTGEPIPHDLDELKRAVEKYGYIIGELPKGVEPVSKETIDTFGGYTFVLPTVLIDKRGDVYIQREMKEEAWHKPASKIRKSPHRVPRQVKHRIRKKESQDDQSDAFSIKVQNAVEKAGASITRVTGNKRTVAIDGTLDGYGFAADFELTEQRTVIINGEIAIVPSREELETTNFREAFTSAGVPVSEIHYHKSGEVDIHFIDETTLDGITIILNNIATAASRFPKEFSKGDEHEENKDDLSIDERGLLLSIASAIKGFGYAYVDELTTEAYKNLAKPLIEKGYIIETKDPTDVESGAKILTLTDLGIKRVMKEYGQRPHILEEQIPLMPSRPYDHYGPDPQLPRTTNEEDDFRYLES